MDDRPTLPEAASTVQLRHALDARPVERFSLVVVDGVDRGHHFTSSLDRCSVGTAPSNDLVLRDETVSRFHCEILMTPAGPRLRDLGSRNGTFIDGLRIHDCMPRDGSLIAVGRTVVRLQAVAQQNLLPVSPRCEFGGLVANSVAMRGAFALLEMAASTDSTLLIEGESGTGKEDAAVAVHEASRRRNGPFITVDCGAIPGDLLESELFGHERGAFTGALASRKGAFEAADGGTIFLDEIGDLPLDMQPKLLRAIEHRQVRRVGSNPYRPVDVRVIAATHRDLRVLVNERTFRSDLYYRLAVVRVRLPALRERVEDLPVIVATLLQRLGATADIAAGLLQPENLSRMQAAAWPGNVRELRNHVERCVTLRETHLPFDGQPRHEDAPLYDPRMSYDEARRQAIAVWERRYLELLLAAHGDHVERAARAAGVGRAHLYRLVAKHGLRR